MLIIVGLFGGLYSRNFANGGVQVFFIGFINLYIYTLLFLYWPCIVTESKETFNELKKAQPRRKDVLGNRLDDFDNIEVVQLS